MGVHGSGGADGLRAAHPQASADRLCRIDGRGYGVVQRLRQLSAVLDPKNKQFGEKGVRGASGRLVQPFPNIAHPGLADAVLPPAKAATHNAGVQQR